MRLAALRVFILIAPYTKRADAEFHIVLGLLYLLIQLLHKLVHVLPAPISLIAALAIFLIALIIAKLHTCYPVRIEVIIQVHTIYIIARAGTMPGSI